MSPQGQERKKENSHSIMYTRNCRLFVFLASAGHKPRSCSRLQPQLASQLEIKRGELLVACAWSAARKKKSSVPNTRRISSLSHQGKELAEVKAAGSNCSIVFSRETTKKKKVCGFSRDIMGDKQVCTSSLCVSGLIKI